MRFSSLFFNIFFQSFSKIFKFIFQNLFERVTNYFVKFTIDKWSPALQIRTVLLSIQALLSAPNPDDPLANDVAEKWKENEEDAINTGRDDFHLSS